MSLACTGCSPLLPSAWPTRTATVCLGISLPPFFYPFFPGSRPFRRTAASPGLFLLSSSSFADRCTTETSLLRGKILLPCHCFLSFIKRLLEQLVLFTSITDDWLLDSNGCDHATETLKNVHRHSPNHSKRKCS